MASYGARAGFNAVGRLWRRLLPAAVVLFAMPAAPVAAVDEGYAAYDRGDYQTAFRELMSSAIAGHAGAQVLLGTMYHLGKGVAQDHAEAARWYRRAADQDDASGQFMLGLMYLDGKGVPHDYAQAARWFRLSADQGDAPAQFQLGLMYVRGQGAPQDYAEALRWFRMAAAQGLAQAQFSLGLMYDRGEGVPQDYIEAVRWYRPAADQGLADAQYNLGVMYANGRGVVQDDVAAVRWYRMAAEQGDAQAQFNLGWRYANGVGVPQDDVLAYMWLNVAAAGSPSGEQRTRTITLRDKVAGRLSPAARARGQELARNWQPGVAAPNGELTDRWWEEAPLVSDEHSDAPLQRRLDSTGTGFAVSQEGHLLTNHHVVADCTEVRVQPPRGDAAEDLPDDFSDLLGPPVETEQDWSDVVDFEDVNPARGEAAAAVIVARDPSNDLALLTAPVRLPVPIALDDRGIRAGDSVVAVGFPLPGLLASEASVTTGTVSALAGIGDDTRLLQVTVPVQPGNSGGPLLDLHGRVVGVVVGKLDALQVASITGDIPQNVNFAIKARSFLQTSEVAGMAIPADEEAYGEELRELSPAAVGAQAKEFTVLVECWK